MSGYYRTLRLQHRLFTLRERLIKPASHEMSGIISAELFVFPPVIVMTSEIDIFRSPMCANDFLDFNLPEEDPAGASLTLSDPSMMWDVNGISSEYGLVMTPSTNPLPPIYQSDLFDQASTGSFPISYWDNSEIMYEINALQSSYVSAQDVSQSFGNEPDGVPLQPSYLSYPQGPLSLHPTDQNPSPSVDGQSGDMSFSSLPCGDSYDLIGAENPWVSGNHSMDTTNCAHNDLYSATDFPMSLPSTSSISDVQNPNAFPVFPGSVPQPEYIDAVASGIQTSRSELLLRPTCASSSYLAPSSSSQLSVSIPYPDVEEWSNSIDDGKDNTSFSSSPPGDLAGILGTEKPSGPSSLTGLDGDNPKSSHAILGSIPRPDESSLAFGTSFEWYGLSQLNRAQSDSWCLHSSSNVALSPDGYKLIREHSIQCWRPGPLSSLSGCFVYYLKQSTSLHSCPVDGCTTKFPGNGVRTHLKTKHRGITTQPYLQCKECSPEASIVAKHYANHLLDRHSDHSIRCAYCLRTQSRVKNVPRHLVSYCPVLTRPKERKASRTGFRINERN
ncbi:hypothetical protein F5146DRAFT_1053849 [Armillaria mellea]|nr:hypothetical protein F5146DRAFT_1053849 [Armillaria mellea]